MSMHTRESKHPTFVHVYTLVHLLSVWQLGDAYYITRVTLSCRSFAPTFVAHCAESCSAHVGQCAPARPCARARTSTHSTTKCRLQSVFICSSSSPLANDDAIPCADGALLRHASQNEPSARTPSRRLPCHTYLSGLHTLVSGGALTNTPSTAVHHVRLIERQQRHIAANTRVGGEHRLPRIEQHLSVQIDNG